MVELRVAKAPDRELGTSVANQIRVPHTCGIARDREGFGEQEAPEDMAERAMWQGTQLLVGETADSHGGDP